VKAARAVLSAGIILVLALIGCGLPLSGEPDQAVPERLATPSSFSPHSPSRTPEPQASPTPLPSPTPAETLEPTPAPEESSSPRLPMAVYFLARDTAQVEQVWRMDPDGTTLDQITSQAEGISAFDVTSSGRRLAYITGNQLVLQELNSGTTRVLVNGEPDDGSDGWNYSHRIEAPRWSLDGRTLAFGSNGLNLVDLETGEIRPVLANRVVDREGFPFPEALFRPDRWSPDGTAILVDVGFYEGAGKAIYNRTEDRTIQFLRPDQTTMCCSSA